jgi:sporulation protein YlmC with PRC-barrel domain
MSNPIRFDVMRDLLDHELLDVNGVSCGMVDDVVLEAAPRGMQIVALLVGPGAWSSRLPALARIVVWRVAGRGRVRVPFAEVAEVSEVIRLRRAATELGLGVVDRRLGAWLKRVIGA